MAELFECPNCRASLIYDAHKPSLTIRCEYCGSTIIVPESLRHTGLGTSLSSETEQGEKLAEIGRLVQSGRKVEAVRMARETFDVGLKEANEIVEAIGRREVIRLGDVTYQLSAREIEPETPTTRSKSMTWIWGCFIIILVAIILGAVLIPVLGGGLALFGLSSVAVKESDRLEDDVGSFISEILPTEQAAPTLEKGPAPEFAVPVLEFGGQEGLGPGFFNDTRQIGIDGLGRIYTADYSGGRVQVFDDSGAFLNLWNIAGEPYIPSIAVDREGVVYVVEGGSIQRYSGVDGESLEPVTNPGEIYFEAAAVGPDGTLVAMGDDRLVRFDKAEGVVQKVDPFSALSDFQTTREDLALDGAGNVFVLGSETIYVVDANGNLVDRIGSRGDAKDQFRSSPTSLALDGQGRLYVDDFKGILVFDSDGRYLDTIPFKGVAFAMVFDDQNYLWIMERNGNRVLKYELNR